MTRYARKLALARKRGDIAAIAILEGGREYTPEPTYQILVARLTPRFTRLTDRLAA
jgi:hypothetical protein